MLWIIFARLMDIGLYLIGQSLLGASSWTLNICAVTNGGSAVTLTLHTGLSEEFHGAFSHYQRWPWAQLYLSAPHKATGRNNGEQRLYTDGGGRVLCRTSIKQRWYIVAPDAQSVECQGQRSDTVPHASHLSSMFMIRVSWISFFLS